MNSDRLKVVFIGAVDRSGSTLLDRMLGQLPGFFSAGELRHIWDRGLHENELCGCGLPFRECPFWRKVLIRAYGVEGLDTTRAVISLRRSVERMRYLHRLSLPLLRGGQYAERLDRYADLLGRLYLSICEVSSSRVIVDSSKTPLHGFVLNAVDEIEVHLIHLVRDSRAVAYSFQRQRVRPEVHWQQAWMVRKGAADSALEWNLRNLLLDALALTSANGLRIRYEDLARRPRATLAMILRHVGEPPATLDFIADHSVHLGPNHTVSGNPARFRLGLVEVQPDEEWKRAMEPHVRDRITRLTWPLLRAYGYKMKGGGPR